MPALSPAERIETGVHADSPRHGFRGERGRRRQALPLALTLAVSRETGSRGIVIAKQAAKRLSWAFYNQETLEYMAHEQHLTQSLIDSLAEDQQRWIEGRLEELRLREELSQNQAVVALARVILALGVKGEAVILGRGAGCLLPADSTLYVRVIAPTEDRIAFLAQLERLTPEQAAEQVVKRDERRARFVSEHFGHSPSDLNQFDLLVNSSRLGEEQATRLVVAAAKQKAAVWSERMQPSD